MSTVEETLAWEAEWRPRAAAAAALGAIAGAGGGIMLAVLTRGGPDETDGFVSLPESLGAAAAGRDPAEPSMIVRQIDAIGDDAALLTVATVLMTLAALGLIGALTYLFRAARARNPQLGRMVGWSVAAALAMYPIGLLLGDISSWFAFADFEDAAQRTPAEAKTLRSEGLPAIGLVLQTFGGFALALAILLVSLNAMRVGLLTRFMGILGIIVGALMILPLDAQFVRWIWLAFLAALIANRYPGGVPPAWATGRAEPWPSQQELRERREALRAEHRADDGPAGDDAEREPAAARPGDPDYVPGIARRKRKKRR